MPGRFETPFAAIVRGERCLVRQAEGDEEGNFTLVLGDARIAVDHPSDLVRAVPEGEAVVASFGPFELVMRRAEDGRCRYVARTPAKDGTLVTGPEDTDEEIALWRLLERLGDDQAPRACFFCRWSEVEPSTGWGNMGCAVRHADAYDAVATSTEPRRRKWGPQSMLSWVDEWQTCDRFEVRPVGYGYRGRPRPLTTRGT